jgi:thiol-disulfide isomerase/thioredoxin
VNRHRHMAIALAFAVAQPVAAAEAPRNFIVHEAPQPTPDVQFTDEQGRTMSLSDFRDKVVLLNIWATWCVPCRKEMPTLDRLQAKLGGPGFEVVALSIDRGGVERVREFYTETGIRHLKIYVDTSGKAAGELGIFGLPGTLLLDREGREIGRLTGPAEWDAPDMVDFISSYVSRQTGSVSSGVSMTVKTALYQQRKEATHD